MTNTGFTPLDFFILLSYLIATLLFGAWVGRGQKNIGDYFLGAKRISWWVICGSIVATETSTLTFIGVPALSYAGALTFLQIGFGYILGRVLISIFLIPAYFKREIQTAYELLTSRFGQRAHSFSAALFQITRALADGVRLFATALVLSVIADLSDLWGVIIIGVIPVIYTLYGGMRSVVWNDVVQLMVYLLGALGAVYILLEAIPGGWSTVVTQAQGLGKFQVFDFTTGFTTPYTFWACLLGGAALTFATHGTDQMMVQRYLACGNQRDSQVALIVSGLVVFLQFGLFLLIGTLLSVFYQGREFSPTDSVVPIFMLEQMPSGLRGLVFAAIFAAAMSTLSSSLNSLASSSINDFYKNYLVKEARDSHYLRASRVFTLTWGTVLIGISLLARNWGSVLEAGLTITGMTMGSLLGIFLLGAWTRRIRQTSALVGMIGGLTAVILVHVAGAVAWTWYVLIGTSLTFGLGIFWQVAAVRFTYWRARR